MSKNSSALTDSTGIMMLGGVAMMVMGERCAAFADNDAHYLIGLGHGMILGSFIVLIGCMVTAAFYWPKD